MRIFLPATAATLRRLPGAPIEARVAFAATPELARVLAGEDDEVVEFSAFLAAADTSVELLAEAQAAGELVAARRVVVTAELAPSSVRRDGTHGHPGAVVVPPVAWQDVAAIHVDEAEAAPDVQSAAGGDPGALERLAERDLLWYDPSELDRLVTQLD